MTRKKTKEIIGTSFQLDSMVRFYELPIGVVKINRPSPCKIISINSLDFNITEKVVKNNGKLIELSKSEFDILYTISRSIKVPVSEEKIFDDIWGDERKYKPGVLSKYISKLRPKILPIKIEVKYSEGYYLHEKIAGE